MNWRKIVTVSFAVLGLVFMWGRSQANAQSGVPKSLVPGHADVPIGSPQLIPLPELMQKGIALLQKKQTAQALQVFQNAAALYPYSFEAQITLAAVSLQTGNYKMSADAAQSAAALNENSARAYEVLAAAQNGLNNYSGALAAEKKAIVLSPDNAQMQMDAGQFAMQTDHYDEAARYFQNSIGLDQANIVGHMALGDAFTQLNENEKALNEYSAALNLLDQLPTAASAAATQIRYQIVTDEATAYSNAKQYSKAMLVLQSLPTSVQNTANTLSALAQINDQKGEHAAAIAQYQKLLQTKPKDAITWGNLGWSQYEAGDLKSAFQSSYKALSFNKTLSYVKFNLGLFYAVQGNWGQSRQIYSEAASTAAPFDIAAGIHDLRNALKRQPANSTLKEALKLLVAAHEHAVLSDFNHSSGM